METRAILEAMRSGAGRDHVIEPELPAALMLRTDAAAFRSVLGNLLENACKYAPQGSTVKVALSTTGKAVQLRVSDTGPGIHMADRARIFDKFFRGGMEETRDTKGTGLGLFIVRKSMEAMGGQVAYEPVLPQGSTFVATFPMHK